MKRLIFITLLLLASTALLEAVALPDNVFGIKEIDERRTDVYFGNGIDTSEDEAYDSRDLLFYGIRDTLYSGNETEMLKELDFKLAYNHTLGVALDMYEAFEQKKGEHKHFWIAVEAYMKTYGKLGSVAVKTLTKEALKEIIKKELENAALQLASGALPNVEELKNLTELLTNMHGDVSSEKFWGAMKNAVIALRDYDLGEQVASYKKNIMSGHGIINVAHSQGNLFANEAYVKLDDWMKPYYRIVSVATPAHTVENKVLQVTFHNDPIRYVYDNAAEIIDNPSQYTWVHKDISYNSGSAWCSEKPDASSTVYHEFAYYMGETRQVTNTYLQNSSYLECNTTQSTVTVSTDKAKTKILQGIGKTIEDHKFAPSQWQKQREIGTCGQGPCEKRIYVEHKYENTLTLLMAEAKVFPFTEALKLYSVPDENNIPHYVKGLHDGTDIEKLFDIYPNVCYILNGTGETIAPSTAPPTPENGVVTVALNWDDADVDLNLDVQWTAGTHDIKDVGCPTEHFYIESEFSIYPGRYPVHVNHSGSVDPSLLPETVQVTIDVPGQHDSYTLDINTSGKLNIGHVADIKVEYIDDEVFVVPLPTSTSVSFSNHTSTPTIASGGGRTVSSSRTGGNTSTSYYSGGTPPSGCNQSCGCIPCQYEIIPYLEQALLGPLSGADVELHVASEFGIGSPVYTGKTSSGSTLYTAGLIDMDEAFKATLDDSELYIFTVSGGKDIDADDDFKIDLFQTVNRGRIHAVLTGKELKEVGFKVNVLTEIAYQVTKEMYGGVAGNEAILAKLDEVASLLLKDKIYTDGDVPLGHTDLLVWLPTVDQELLFADYASSIQPIVDSIYYDQDIYEAAYNVVYSPNGVAAGAPRLKSSILYVDEHAPAGTYVGNVRVFSEGSSAITSMTMSGEGSKNFVLADNGSVSVSQTANLDFEIGQIYKLSAIATNADGESAPVSLYVQLRDVVDIPVATSFVGYKLFDNAETGVLIGMITFNEGAAPITSMVLSGEGSEYFEIDTEGRITVGAEGFVKFNETQSEYREKSNFALAVIAANALGESLPVSLGLEVYHVRVTPTLMPLSVSVDENATARTVIGSVAFNEGNSPIISFTLSGSGSENFEIDTVGTITLAEGANLDYETTASYALKASASNDAGESEVVQVNIRVNNSPDVPELKTDLALHVDENATAGTLIGNIVRHEGSGTITEITLHSSGVSYDINDMLEVDLNGDIRLNAGGDLDYESLRRYYFQATAMNAEGSSAEQYYVIDVNNSPDVPELVAISADVYENAPAGTYVGNVLAHSGSSAITSFLLGGNGSENFEVDLNGDITVSSTASLNFENTKSYYLSASAANAEGTTKSYFSIRITDVLDVPLLNPLTTSVDENSAEGTVAGQLQITEGASSTVSVVLNGDGSEDFTVDINGTVRVAPGASIDYERRKNYYLLATAANTQGSSLPVSVRIGVNDLLDVPIVQSFTASVDENASAGTVLGSVLFNEGASPITALEFSGSGSEFFAIDLTGKVTVSVTLDYEQRSSYHFYATATNALGTSLPQSVSILVNDVLDSPVVQPFSASIDEGTAPGTVAGTIDFTNGLHPVTSFTLSGEDNALFTIAQDGTVSLTDGVVIDYERQAEYNLEVTAVTASETSFPAAMQITVNNIVDLPVLSDFSTSITENGLQGVAVGTVQVINYGDSPITSMALSGTGSEEFAIGTNGVVSLHNNLKFDYERYQEYNLTLLAHTATGSSEGSAVNIAVNNLLDAPTYLDFNGDISEDADPGTVIGQIGSLPLRDTNATSMELTGEGSDDFFIDKNGKITLADIQLDYETRSIYMLQAGATTQYGNSNMVDVTIDINDVDEYAEAGLGRWGNAGVKIYKLEDNGTKTLMFSETTSAGGDIDFIGLFDSHRLELDQDSFYLYEVSRGDEYDADNDGTVDVSPTPNSGTIHAVVKGSWVRHINWRPRVSLMTEVYYHWAANEIESFNAADLESRLLDQRADINKDLNGDSTNYWLGNAIDALLYDPVHDLNAWNQGNFPQRSLEYLGVKIYENDPAYALFISNSFISPSRTEDSDVALSNDKTIVFSVDRDNGLRVIDITDVTSPTMTEIMPGQMESVIVSADDSRLFIKEIIPSQGEGDEETALRIIDISDLSNPVELSLTNLSPFNAMQLSNDETKLYVTFSDGYDNGLRMIDVSNVSQPLSVTEVTTPGIATDFALSKDESTAYVADGRGGLQIVDISNPDVYTVSGEYIVDGLVQKMLLSEDETMAYLIVNNSTNRYAGAGQLYVIYISDKTDPVLNVNFNLANAPLSALTLTSDETKIIVSASSEYGYHEKIYESIWGLEDIRLLGETPSNYYASSDELILTEGETVMLAVSYYKIDIIDISDPSNPVVLGSVMLNYPPE